MMREGYNRFGGRGVAPEHYETQFATYPSARPPQIHREKTKWLPEARHDVIRSITVSCQLFSRPMRFPSFTASVGKPLI